METTDKQFNTEVPTPSNGPERLISNIQKNFELAKARHQDKMNRSTTHFKDARVTSCSGVLLRNGRAVCVAFPGKEKNQEINKSSEVTSWN
jgi:hypothetical protein